MDLGYDAALFILAFDHRGSFKKMFRAPGDGAADPGRLEEAKRLVWQGFLEAHRSGLPEGAGILVDEELGAEVAREAAAMGIPFAMPVERSGQDVFDFEYGEDFGNHIEEFDPTFAKVLVRWNPADDEGVKALQGERLRRLGDWLHERGRRFLFELLVPAGESQMELLGGDTAAYDTRLRPMLMLQAIGELHRAGVEPDVWKIEGIDDPGDAALVSRLTRAEGRDRVRCVVLGRGADEAAVDRWLRAGAVVPGYGGFAIGRTIWSEAVAGWKDGALSPEAAARRIADKYRRFIDLYSDAAGEI